MGRFERWNDHPPLGRLWLTLPIAATPLDYVVQFTDRDFLFTRLNPRPEWLAWHTRPMNTLLGMAWRRAMVCHAPHLLRRRGQCRAGTVCLYAFADRAFLGGYHRRHRSAVHLPGRSAANSLATLSDRCSSRADGPGARRPAAVEVLRPTTGIAGSAADVVPRPAVRRACSPRRLNWKPALAALGDRATGPVGGILLSRLASGDRRRPRTR